MVRVRVRVRVRPVSLSLQLVRKLSDTYVRPPVRVNVTVKAACEG